MKEILISGVVGWDITANKLRGALLEAQPGEEVRLVVDSPGGDCFEMIPVYNVIRDFARNNPQPVTTYIQGSAMSAASLIALAAKAGNKNNRIEVEDNSVFMIHNCWTCECGDHRAMEKAAKETLRIDELQRTVFARQSGKSRNELEALMNETTYLYGTEIVENGFADGLVADTGKENPEGDAIEAMSASKYARLTFAAAAFADVQHRMRAQAYMPAAGTNMTANVSGTYVSNKTPSADAGEKTEEARMTEEELKQKFPALYAQVLKTGADAERARVQAHIKMASDSGDVGAAVEFIASGVQCSDNAAIAKYHEVFTASFEKKQRAEIAALRSADSVPDTINPPGEDSGEKALAAAFANETGIQG